ncbi:MAG TPA: RES family NAD+ phosphorylase [Xanthobacteraceae bacterium]|nr:RES family NAD+ phosphorylase [Xanthobacteraceae bacterium]
MRLWRVSDFADLTGQGGLLAGARWHSRGRRIVYLADHPAVALIELLVHLEVDAAELPDTFQLLAVDVTEDIASETVGGLDLPIGRQKDPTFTRTVGDRWLAEGRTALLQVPSALLPATFNWLLNPVHIDAARIKIAEIIETPFDSRLLPPAKPAGKRRPRARARRGRGRNPRPSGGSGRRRTRR